MIDNSLVLDIVDNISDERELAWVYKKVRQFKPYTDKELIPVTNDEYFKAILKFLDGRHFKNITERNNYVRRVKAECKASLLPMHEFKWIDKKDDRLCQWLWLNLNKSHGLKASINSSNEIVRYKDIIRHFDSIPKSTYEKLVFINELRISWESKSNIRVADYQWLDKKNHTQCRWAFHYLEKKSGDQDSPYFIEQSNSCPNLYAMVMASIDLWEATDIDRSAFAKKMDLAWKQKQTRAKIKKREEGLKLKLTKKYLLMLDDVSELYEHKNVSKTLELLIKKEHEKLVNSWK